MRASAGRKWWLAATWALVSLAVLASLTMRHGYWLTAIGDLTQSALLLIILFFSVANARKGEGRARLFWGLIALGCALWSSAQVLWTYFEVFAHKELPNPFVGDVLFFLHLVPMMGAMAVQPHRDQDEQIARLGTVDLLLLFVGWLYLYFFVVIPWQYVSFQEALYGRSFDVVYFLEHAVFLVSVMVVRRRSKGAWRTMYGQLLGAATLYAVSSVTISVGMDFAKYHTGSLYDVPLVGSMVWFATLTLNAQQLTFRNEHPKEWEERRGVWASRLAMAAILSLPLLAGWAVYVSHAPAKVRTFRLLLTLATMMLMGALVSLKQYRLDKELARANQDLREASLTDLLTGTRNRRFFTSIIETDIKHVLRSYSPSADASNKKNRDLIFYLIDADYFKEVNDRYGHEEGDQVLVEIARRISSAIRHSDVLIRWGGEEFLVVSRYTNREEAAALATRVLNAVGRDPFVVQGDEKIRRTCSIGWAVFPWFVSQPGAVDYREALRLADSALYQAKKEGRNRAIGMLPISEECPTVPGCPMRSEEEKFSERLEVRTVLTLGPPPTGNENRQETPANAKAAVASQEA